MDNLKPCPFCGGEAITCKIEQDSFLLGRNIFFYAAQCDSCNVKTPLCKTEEQAIEIWNRRIEK